jgi:four helix bundle protein
MTYQRFEDLPVWEEAIRLAEGCEDFLEAAGRRISRGKQDQLDRCSMSVSNNIAEGFERGTTNETLAFIYIARGSAGECRSMLAYFARRPKLEGFRDEIARLRALAESCSRQLRGWADSLQNSEIKGQRHLNAKTKKSWQRKKSAGELERSIIARLPPGHPARDAWEKKHGPAGEPEE